MIQQAPCAMRNPKVDRDLLQIYCRQSKPGTSGKQQTVLEYKWYLNGYEPGKGQKSAEVQSWDELLEHQSHRKISCWQRSRAQGGLPRRHNPAVVLAVCMCPGSTLPCLSPSSHSYKNIHLHKFTKSSWTEWLTLSAHARLLVVTVSYSTNGHHQHSTHLQQVSH